MNSETIKFEVCIALTEDGQWLASLHDNPTLSGNGVTPYIAIQELFVGWRSYQEQRDRLTREALDDVSIGNVVTNEHVRAWANGLAPSAGKAVGFLRRSFQSRAHYADFALNGDAPLYSVTLASSASEREKAAFDLAKGEALFSNDLDELRRIVLCWDTNKLRVFLHDAGNGRRTWAIAAAPDFPDLLDRVFLLPSQTPRLDAPIEDVEQMASKQICDHPNFPLIIVDREVSSWYLDEIVKDPACARGW